MPLEQKQYVAIDAFSIPLDNGKNNISIKKGDTLTFDGLTVDVSGISGMAKSLTKAIGMWIVPLDSKSKKATKSSTGPMNTRNATGGRIVENSEATQDLGVREQQRRTYDELQELVTKYERESGKTVVVDDEAEMRKAAEEKKRAQVIDEDATIVAQVKRSPDEQQTNKNTSGVQIDNQKEQKRMVVSSEERVVKSTNYDKTKETAPQQKHLVVDHDAQGVVVKKTGAAQKAPAQKMATSKISKEERVVKETVYDKNERTDIGSSTQTQMTSTKDKPRIKIVAPDGQDQEAVVFSKVSKANKLDVQGGTLTADDDGSIETADGIVSRVTVGGNTQTDQGDVSFSSNSDIDVGEVEISRGGTDVTDLSGARDGDSDIDVNDILKDL